MEQSPQKKRVRFSIEKLNLVCEWECCTVVENDMHIFVHHIITEHLTKLDPGDLHCHWKYCEGFTDNLSEFRRHILLHAFHSKIKCYGANLQIRRKLPNCSSNIHSRNIVPELPEPLLCCWEDCMMEYECPEYFYRHVDGHAMHDSKKDETVMCLWQDCNRTFSDSYKVKDHLRSHTQEKLIACPTCGGMFASRTKFFDHIERQQVVDEEKAELFACEFCPRKMNSERLLRDHMRKHVNHYKCPFCDMTCPTPSAIAHHVSYRHSEEKPHACQYCDYRSKAESDLRKHLESHSIAPSCKCPIENCTYATRSQTCYRAHYRKVHEKKHPIKYSCHLCEKVFSRGNYLTKHLLNHHKFRWPSGHCRFRYFLNEEGVYRLQTVRYESLELSQEMMGENAEDIDNPDVIENIPDDNKNITDSKSNIDNISQQHSQCSMSISNGSMVLPELQVPQTTQITNSYVAPSKSQSCTDINVSDLPISQISNVSTYSAMFPEKESHTIDNPKALPVIYVPCINPEGQTISEEPILIKILDDSDSAMNSFTEQNTVLQTGLNDYATNQTSTVQCITANSKGALIFNSIEITEES